MPTVHIVWHAGEFRAFRRYSGRSNHLGDHSKTLSSHCTSVELAYVDRSSEDNTPIVGAGATKSDALETLQTRNAPGEPTFISLPIEDHPVSWGEMTKYPRIFTVYWGNFAWPSHPGVEIINNRNTFVETYKIQKQGGPMYARGEVPREWDDHHELYKCAGGGFVSVRSPYEGRVGDAPVPPGWTEIEPIYHPDARTIMQFVRGRTRGGGGLKHARSYHHML
jgi:hypothetical protein